jgi:hypothetical protein
VCVSGTYKIISLVSGRSAGSGSLSSMELVEAMSGSLTDQVTVLKPLELSSHELQWRKAVWCAPPKHRAGAAFRVSYCAPSMLDG